MTSPPSHGLTSPVAFLFRLWSLNDSCSRLPCTDPLLGFGAGSTSWLVLRPGGLFWFFLLSGSNSPPDPNNSFSLWLSIIFFFSMIFLFLFFFSSGRYIQFTNLIWLCVLLYMLHAQSYLVHSVFKSVGNMVRPLARGFGLLAVCSGTTPKFPLGPTFLTVAHWYYDNGN